MVKHGACDGIKVCWWCLWRGRCSPSESRRELDSGPQHMTGIKDEITLISVMTIHPASRSGHSWNLYLMVLLFYLDLLSRPITFLKFIYVSLCRFCEGFNIVRMRVRVLLKIILDSIALTSGCVTIHAIKYNCFELLKLCIGTVNWHAHFQFSSFNQWMYSILV